MMDFPQISIVTPSYNQGRFIGQTIDSILSQNYPNLEYIVMDGGSTDETVDILKSYGNKIQWVSQKDNGQADAVNKGLQMSHGEILAYINSDDCYMPDTFHHVAQEFVRTQCQWLTGSYRIVDRNLRSKYRYIVYYKNLVRYFSSLQTLSIVNYIIQPSTFWRRELWNSIGPFDTALHLALDYDFWMRAMQKDKPCISKRCLSMFRVHPSSKGNIQYSRQFDEEMQVLRRYNHNNTTHLFHRTHNMAIKFLYRLIK